MLRNIHHIAFVVENIDESKQRFEAIFDVEMKYRENSDNWNHETALFGAGDNIIEFIAPTTNEGWAYEYLQQNGEGFFHMAFEVDDIRKRMSELEQKGVGLVHDEPQPAGIENAWELVTIAEDETIVPMQLIEDNRESRFSFS
jgi:methylmalonyl-CoA/ethylmalonyl-CoA epimerase